ncbi:hypothetical protein [Xanthomonas sacchari]|uniref:hypothetical protein n=1 Tax=Xanthomonas sacchari TaxID=56458 RepID=UPI0020C1C54E|nr:hypothetical protein [Xanthomonas sacchari]
MTCRTTSSPICILRNWDVRQLRSSPANGAPFSASISNVVGPPKLYRQPVARRYVSGSGTVVDA